MSIQKAEPGDLKGQKWLENPLRSFYRARIITVEPVIFLFLVFNVLYIFTMEQYYYQYYGEAILRNTSFNLPNGTFCINSSLINQYTSSNDSYKQDETSSNHLVIYTELACKVPSVFIALAMGPISDKYGRKLAILLPSCGFLLQGLASIVLIHYGWNPYFFIPVRFVTGMTGDFTTLIAGCFAYVADISSINWRSIRLGFVSGALGFGKMASLLFGGYWLSAVHCNFIPVMIFEASVMAVLILYAFTLPESRPKPKEGVYLLRRKTSLWDKYIDGAKLYCSELSFTTWSLTVLTATVAVLVLTVEGSFVIAVYFLKAPPFDFTSSQMGYYQAAKGGIQGIGNTLFFLLVLLRLKDSWIVLVGMLISGTCNMLTGFSNTVWELYTISAVQGFEALVFSAGRGMASKLVKPEQQGSLFSIIASAESVAALIASTVWPYVFPITLEHNLRPGTTFMFMGAAGLATVPFLLSVTCIEFRNIGNRNRKKTARYEVTNEDKSEPSKCTVEDTSAALDSSSSEEEEYKSLLTSIEKI